MWASPPAVLANRGGPMRLLRPHCRESYVICEGRTQFAKVSETNKNVEERRPHLSNSFGIHRYLLSMSLRNTRHGRFSWEVNLATLRCVVFLRRGTGEGKEPCLWHSQLLDRKPLSNNL